MAKFGIPGSLMRPAPPTRPQGAVPSREVQELWFATRRQSWTSLCIVPASPGSSAVPIAEALAQVGRIIHNAPVRVVRAEGMDLGQIAQLVMEMTGKEAPSSSVWTSQGPAPGGPDDSPVIIALESVVANPLVLPVALASDVILLSVELGQTNLAYARHSVQLLGRDRLLGSVLVRPG